MNPRKTKASGMVSRDPERTRARILDAAFAEFAGKGFAGARVDTIARRARSNKRMLYHYFTDKKGLFSAVLRKKMGERKARVYGGPAEFIASLPEWFGKNCTKASCRPSCTPWCAAAWFAENSRDKDWVRVLAWEALQAMNGPVVDEARRRETARQAVAHIRKDQSEGKINPAYSPEYLQLAMVSLAMFPVVLPQIARFIVGCPPSDAKFQRNYSEFLKQFTATIRPPGQG